MKRSSFSFPALHVKLLLFPCGPKNNPVSDIRGFTLVELAAAIGVLGIITAALLALLAGGFSSTYLAGRRSQAVGAAQEKMEELKAYGYAGLLEEGLKLEETFTCPGEASFFEEDIPAFPGLSRRYHLQCETKEVGGYLIQGMAITVEVFSGGGDEVESLVLLYSFTAPLLLDF